MQVKNEKLTVTAPAKINLHLTIFDRRTDGFHNLDSILLALDFGDTLHFQPVDKANFTDIVMEQGRGGNTEKIPMKKNLIFKALSLFREKTGFFQGFKIIAEKRIPAGGGLGGGSSNAASTLLALNKLAGFPLSKTELLELAAALGSDAPFFIYETAAAKVTGRGEFITPMEVPPFRHFTLVNPGFKSDTAAAFKLLDEYREKKREPEKSGYSNDFLDCFNDPEKSIYRDIISKLKNNGADFAGLSGSGSTCFGAFKEKLPSETAAETLRGEWEFVESCGIFR